LSRNSSRRIWYAEMGETDKRSSIRVNARVLLKIRKLSPQDYQTRIDNFAAGVDTPVTDCLSHPVLSYDIKPHLKKIREKEEALAAVLDVLDQKLSFIIQKMQEGEEQDKGFASVDADISAAGIAFVTSEPMETGQHLELQIGLLPDYRFFLAMGRVVRVNTLKNGRYRIAVAFKWITEDDRERLIEYLFQRQVMQLRMRRMQREKGEEE